MWRRTYLLLLLVRVYLALSPSYIHPDENFQGPEILAGDIFSYPSHATWEFTSSKPIRSYFPIWLAYGIPMNLIKLFWSETLGNGATPPYLVYYTLRVGMFVLSLVLEDWAVYELVTSPRRRRQAVVLVASSYVTWTYQAHTFSNSLETLLVAWALVLIERILEDRRHSSFIACAILSFVLVIGIFNRITFPAFIVIPALPLLPHFYRRPLSLACILVSGIFFSLTAIYIDTRLYGASSTPISDIFRSPVITPLNNLLYNADASNLAEHGIHPRYQHILVNLTQLLGPAYIFLGYSLWPRARLTFFDLWNSRALSAISGAAILSIFPHQEARFLMPSIPLLLTCFRPPKSRIFLATWVIFNSTLGLLMGVYHQGGVVPVQLHIPTLLTDSTPASLSPTSPPSGAANVFWWKTYPPPLWLLGENATTTDFSIQTHDLMGIPGHEMLKHIEEPLPNCNARKSPPEYPPTDPETGDLVLSVPNDPTLLVAPSSNMFLDNYTRHASDVVGEVQELRLYQLWKYKHHLNLDDMDFAEDGVFRTLRRVFGRRGLSVFLVSKGCA